MHMHFRKPTFSVLTKGYIINLEAGKAMMRRKIEEAQAQFTERSNQ
jgi:hypothetical protein